MLLYIVYPKSRKDYPLQPLPLKQHYVQNVSLLTFPLFFEQLHVTMQIRLYLQPFWLDGASARLSVLPYGIVVAPSDIAISLAQYCLN